MKLLQCYIVTVCLFFALSSASVNLHDSAQDCDLECWLANLTIVIPPQSIIQSGFNLSFANMKCSGIQIGGINSSYVPPTGLILNPYGITVGCVADWSFREVDWPHVSGSGGVQVAVGDSSMKLGLVLNKGPDGLSNSATTTICTSDVVIQSIQFSGGIIDKILNLFKSYIASTVQTELNAVACGQLTNLINTNLTQILLQVDQQIRPYLTPQYNEPPPVPSTGIIDLTKEPIIRVASHLVSLLFQKDSPITFNYLMDKVTNNGTFMLPTSLINATQFTVPVAINGSVYGNLNLGILSLNATGLNTWGMIDLEAKDNRTLSIHTETDNINFNVSFFINVTTDGGVLNVSETLNEQGSLVVSLSNNNMELALQLAILEKAFNSLKIMQFMDVGCVMGSLYNVNLTELFFNMTTDHLAIIATNGAIEKDIDELINNILVLFTNSFDNAIPAFFNSYIATAVESYANEFFGQEINNSSKSCADSPKEVATTNIEGVEYSFGSAGAIIVLLVVVTLIFQRKTAVVDEDESVSLLGITPRPPSMPLFLHSRIPAIVRFGLPILLVLNVALFISSNTSVGASVYLVLTAGDRVYQTPALFNFSLSNSIRDMWNAGVYPLSILIAAFSGAWPYLKLFIMLFCWFVPVNVLSEKKREKLLMFLDMFGKWSLIDSFVLVLMVVSFQFHLGTVVPNTDPEIVGSLDVFVEAYWGFYSFLLATMTSLIFSHLILGYHNHAVESEEAESPAIRSSTQHRKAALMNLAFKKPNFFKKSLVLVLLLLTIGLICWGVSVFSFAFDFRGAAGWALKLNGEPTKRHYSVITLGSALPGSSMNPHAAGIRYIQATFFAFTISVPLAHLVVVTYLWLVPLKFSAQRKVFVVTEVLNAWSALEVFVIAIIASILEIRQFAAFIVGDKCDPINALMKEYFNAELNGDTKCFDVIATLESGCWILFSACIIYFGVASFVMRMCHKAIKEHTEEFTEIN